jgi:hypothetical protein
MSVPVASRPAHIHTLHPGLSIDTTFVPYTASHAPFIPHTPSYIPPHAPLPYTTSSWSACNCLPSAHPCPPPLPMRRFSAAHLWHTITLQKTPHPCLCAHTAVYWSVRWQWQWWTALIPDTPPPHTQTRAPTSANTRARAHTHTHTHTHTHLCVHEAPNIPKASSVAYVLCMTASVKRAPSPPPCLPSPPPTPYTHTPYTSMHTHKIPLAIHTHSTYSHIRLPPTSLTCICTCTYTNTHTHTRIHVHTLTHTQHVRVLRQVRTYVVTVIPA